MYNSTFERFYQIPSKPEREKAFEQGLSAVQMLLRVLPCEPMLGVTPAHTIYKQREFVLSCTSKGALIHKAFLPIATDGKTAFKQFHEYYESALTCHWSGNESNKWAGYGRLLTPWEVLPYTLYWGLTPCFRDGVFCLDIDGDASAGVDGVESWEAVCEYCASLGCTFLAGRTNHGGHLLFRANDMVTSTQLRFTLPSGREVKADFRANGNSLSVWGVCRGYEWEWEPRLYGTGDTLSDLPELFTPSKIGDLLDSFDNPNFCPRNPGNGQGTLTLTRKENLYSLNRYTQKLNAQNGATVASYSDVIEALPGARTMTYNSHIYGVAKHCDDPQKIWEYAKMCYKNAKHPPEYTDWYNSTASAIASTRGQEKEKSCN